VKAGCRSPADAADKVASNPAACCQRHYGRHYATLFAIQPPPVDSALFRHCPRIGTIAAIRPAESDALITPRRHAATIRRHATTIAARMPPPPAAARHNAANPLPAGW